MAEAIFNRWGKAARGDGGVHLLVFHMLDVAAVMEVGLARRPDLLRFLADGLRMEVGAARAMLLTLAALHDLGKVALSFQWLNPAAARALGIPAVPTGAPVIRHDAVGQALLVDLVQRRRLPLGLPPGLADHARAPLLFALATGHHGQPPAKAGKAKDLVERGVMGPDDPAIAAALVTAMADRFGWRDGLPDPAGLCRLSPLLNGLFSLCDWLGSAETFPYRNDPLDPGEYHRTIALPGAERVLDMVQPAPFRRLAPRGPARFADLFPTLGRGGAPPVPSPLQALVDRLFTDAALPDGPLLTIIEDLPGSGKTEAGDLIIQRLIALGRADGAYIGLPTMATADAAFARKLDADGTFRFGTDLFQETPQVMLAHSRRRHNPAFTLSPTRAGVEEGEGMALDWFGRSARRALLTDLGVGTVDQALAGALRARYATLRLAGLWRKVLLVDEVHAYDPYMRMLLHALLRWQGMMGDPVVLMSATVPARIRAELVRAYADGAGWTDVAAMAGETKPGAYPLLTTVSRQGIAQHPVDPVPGPGTRPVRFQPVHSAAEVEDWIRHRLAAGDAVLWFRNTVDDAVEAWERLAPVAAALGAPPPLLYHARYLPADRARQEAALLGAVGKTADPAARRARLVIATQAAEQSLDLDVDAMVTDLAPADAVIQRIGRRRRHARTAAGALAADGVEGRADSPVLLHMPPLEMVPGPRWYAGTFPRAATIYPDDARLWLTAHLLLHPRLLRTGGGAAEAGPGDGLVLARDIRALMEAVYAEPPAGAPAILMRRHDTAEGEAAAEAQQGRIHRLPFRDGLVEDWGQAAATAHAAPDAAPDADPRTRLIDSHTVVLATLTDGFPRLLGAHVREHRFPGHPVREGESPLESSECRSPRPLHCLPAQEPAIARLAETLPDRETARLAGAAVVFLTTCDSTGTWHGTALDPTNPTSRPLPLRYCPDRGFQVGR